jgi:hypothetical protein
MKTSQYERIGKLLTRKTGATAMDIASVAGTVSPHSRLAEMKARGWHVTRRQVPGKSYGTYHGVKP